jgi:hypothetical protein
VRGGPLPLLLEPPPDASVATFADELERIRATPPEVVHEEVETYVRMEKGLFGLSAQNGFGKR